MSITRVKSAGWGVNEKLRSVDISAVDANTSFALDKRSGQTDTLASTVTVTGAMTHSAPVTFNGNMTQGSGSAALLSGSVSFASGGSVSFNGSLTVNSGASFSAGSVFFGASVAMNGPVTSVSATWNLGGPVLLSDPRVLSRVSYQSTQTFTRVIHSTANDAHWKLLGPKLVTDTSSPTTDTPTACFTIDDMPDGCSWTDITVGFTPPGSHVAVPATLPVVYVHRVDLATGVTSLLFTLPMSAPANLGAYEQYNTIDYTFGTPVTINRALYRYTVTFTAESGTAALTGTFLAGCVAKFTSAAMDTF